MDDFVGRLFALMPGMVQEAQQFEIPLADYAQRECSGNLFGSPRQAMLHMCLQEVAQGGNIYKFVIEAKLTSEEVNNLCVQLEPYMRQHLNLRLFFAYGGPEHGPEHMAFLCSAL